MTPSDAGIYFFICGIKTSNFKKRGAEMRKSNFFRLAAAFGLVLAVAAPSAYAAGERTGAGADVEKFKTQIQENTDLSQADIDAIEPQLNEFAQHDADPQAVSDLAKTAVDNDCTGPCLRDVLASMSSAMQRGLSDTDAHDMVSQTLRDQVQAREGEVADPADLGSDIRASVDSQLAGMPGGEGAMDGGTTGGGAAGGTMSGDAGQTGQSY